MTFAGPATHWPRVSRIAAYLALSWMLTQAWPTLAQGDKQPTDSRPDLRTFVGTWTATYKGEVFATLVLTQERGTLRGTLNNFDLSVDKEGNLTDGTHKDDGDAPLLNVRFKSGALYFIVLEKDQYRDGMNWKFVPINARQGELSPVLDHQADVPKDLVIKPIRMTREPAQP
ncbi:MAG TPA: hypothetical protein VEJ45_09595 [Candidatus Acidoferrales bacterium]|nr:hypothetical protein [Candidatus Acidoferrales bacterium]